MVTFVVLVIYIIGVWVAYSKITEWSNKKVKTEEDYQDIFRLSTISWLIFPVYGIAWLFGNIGEEE